MIRYRVRVTPNAKKAAIVQDGGILKVKVDAPPRDGEANKRLIKILAEYFEVAPSCVSIVSGFSSRDKMIEIVNP